MTKLTPQTIKFMRTAVDKFTERPTGALIFTDKEFPNTSLEYSVSITDSVITINQSSTQFNVEYVNKSSRQVALELNNSPFPISVRAVADIAFLKSGELQASGSVIPKSFHVQDRTLDGKGCIVRCKRWMAAYKRTSALTLSLPAFQGVKLPWWAKISTGEFKQLYNGNKYFFGVPEYDNQVWSSLWGKPFRDVQGELAQFADSTTITLANSPIHWKGNNIILSPADSDKVFSSKIIKDVDVQNGIIYLKPGTVLPEDVIVFYSYIERNYIYPHLDLNAHFTHNPFLLDAFIVFYARPYSGSNGLSRQRSIYHSVGESLPAAIGAIPPGDYVGEPITLIGAINIRPSIDKTDLSALDTRSYGGGIQDNRYGAQVERLHPRTNYFFDIGRKEGLPYGGSAATVIELPPELKEIMSVEDIHVRAKQFLAAGVYPVIKFPEEDYKNQFELSDHNTDVSLINYPIQNVLAKDSNVFGLHNEAADWIADSLVVPESGVYGDYTTSELKGGPSATGNLAFNQSSSSVYMGELASLAGEEKPVNLDNQVLHIAQGESYYQSYIRSSPTPVFSYEQKTQRGTWERKTVRDEIDVLDKQLSAGKIRITSELGTKEIRHFTGFAPYRLDTATGEFWTTLAARCVDIYTDIRALTTGSYGVTTLEVPDVSTTVTGLISTEILPGVDPLYEPWLKNYHVCTSKNIYSGSTEIGSAALYGYDATNYSMTGTLHSSGEANYGSFPRRYVASSNSSFTPDPSGFADVAAQANAWRPSYDAIKDLIAYSKYSTARSNEFAASAATGRDPSILVGTAGWVIGAGDDYASYAHSGCVNIINRIHFCHYVVKSGWYGGDTTDVNAIPIPAYNQGLSDIISPTFNSQLKRYPGDSSEYLDGENLLLTGHGTSEVDVNYNELYNRAAYVEGFAAFYASMPCPASGEHTHPTIYVPVSGNPRNIAMSGLAMCNETFMTGHFNNPTYQGTGLQDTWLTRYNRLSKLGGVYADSICSAYDSLYYGNEEWAGYSGYISSTAPYTLGNKIGPYYQIALNNNLEYKHDTYASNIKWPDGVTRTFEDSMKYSLSGVYHNLTGMAQYVEVGAKRGGMLLPGTIDLLRRYIWLPTHSGNADPLFTSATNEHLARVNMDELVNTFEVGMDAVIKGMFSEDGILKEGGGFKSEMGPFAATVPSKIFKACGDAILYYRSVENNSMENKWTALAEGMFNTSEKLYSMRGGYPTNATHGVTQVAGDVGSVPLDGYLYLLGSMTGAFSSAQFKSLTGLYSGKLA